MFLRSSFPPQRSGVNRIEAVIVANLLLLTTLLLLPACVSRVQPAHSRTQSINNLKQIVLAMHGFHDVNGRIPFNGTRDAVANDPTSGSWAFQILPYIDQAPLFGNLNQQAGVFAYMDPARPANGRGWQRRLERLLYQQLSQRPAERRHAEQSRQEGEAARNHRRHFEHDLRGARQHRDRRLREDERRGRFEQHLRRRHARNDARRAEMGERLEAASHASARRRAASGARSRRLGRPLSARRLGGLVRRHGANDCLFDAGRCVRRLLDADGAEDVPLPD